MLKKSCVACLKLTLVVGLFVFLIARASQGSAFSELNVQNLNGTFLFLGFFFNLIATTITVLRWRLLLQALDAPLSLYDSLKIGFIGFLFNLSPVGIVGGDAVKVVLATKKTRASVDRAAASVVVDRVLGLYSMFVLGLIVVAATGFGARTEPVALFATRGLIALTIALTIFLLFVVSPTSSKGWRRKTAAKIPFIGGFLEKLTAATIVYRNKKRVLLVAFLSTFLVHAFFAVSLYCFARGVYSATPNVADHFVLYCVGNVGSTIPLSAGPFEYFLDELYPLFPIAGKDCFERGYGMTIGVVYRLGTIAVALVGVVFYLGSRRTSRDSYANLTDETR